MGQGASSFFRIYKGGGQENADRKENGGWELAMQMGPSPRERSGQTRID